MEDDDIKICKRLIKIAKINPNYTLDAVYVQAIENVLQKNEKYKNMYNAEHRIHKVRNEQLARMEKSVQKAKQLELDNLQLIDLYRRTAQKLKENGKYELADYFLAQINDIPTFSVNSAYNEWIKISELEELYSKMDECTDYIEPYRMFQKFIKEKTESKYPT